MNSQADTESVSTHCYILIPTKISSREKVSGCAEHFVKYLRQKANALAPACVHVWLVDAERKTILCFDDGLYVTPTHFEHSGPHVMVNVSFLLQDSPPISLMSSQALSNSISVCANASSRDVYSFAWAGKIIPEARLWSAVLTLTTTLTTSFSSTLEYLFDGTLIAPSDSSESNSPTSYGIPSVESKRSSDAPIYLNTAFSELFDNNIGEPENGSGSANAIEMLLALRQASSVPWIFNALINQIEYREGTEEPSSIPPEVHLSLTGVCNLECRFCTYTSSNAIFKYVDLDKVKKLDFLEHVQILRLSSGLGEPTLNKHLPEIINYLAEKFPHLQLNFFTNAVVLNRPGLIDSLLNQVKWINVSLNAASVESWKIQHQDDKFERVCANLLALKKAKAERNTVLPLVFGSIVLNGKNLHDLPLMPALCRQLGIDRLTGFPYFALGYHTTEHTFGEEETLEKFRKEYDQIYELTVQQAKLHQVSLEIPEPMDRRLVRYGMEVRGFYDFAKIEKNEWQLGQLIETMFESVRPRNYCQFLWKIACVGSTHKGSRANNTTNYLYPCIGPLSSAELSRATAFDFPNIEGFSNLWRNNIFKHLRFAQKISNVCAVCDFCRDNDSRNADNFSSLEQLVAEFTMAMDALVSTDAKTI